MIRLRRRTTCALLLSLLALPMAALAQEGGPRACDVDVDGDIDRLDVQLINDARNQPASGVTDPRDVDGDKLITVSDARICATRCSVGQCAVNGRPVANAGADQNIFVGTTATLTGAASTDPDGNPLTFVWRFLQVPASSEASLANPTTISPTFVPDVDGTYTVQLVVNDGSTDSLPDQVALSTVNTPPVPNAGPDQAVITGTTVTLDGSGSTDVNGDTLQFSWALTTRPNGSTAQLTGAQTMQPTFVPDLAGLYQITLTVDDGRGGTATDTVDITTTAPPTQPVANAGPDQAIAAGQTIQLNGSGSSDPNNVPLTYRWSFVTRPAQSAAALSDATAVNPTFVADRPGDYVVQLIVNNGQLDSVPDTVLITTNNTPPVANAGEDLTATVGTTVVLAGNGSSDANGDPLSYQWSLTGQPANSTASVGNATAPVASLVPDVVGLYSVQLIVNDGTVDSAPDTAAITATPLDPQQPIANAGPAQTVFVVDTIQLDGTGSLDPQQDPLTYLWSVSSAPPNTEVTFSSTTVVNPTARVNTPGLYVLRLVVNDGQRNSAPSLVPITVLAVPALNIADVQVTEGNTGTVTATLNVTLSAAINRIVTASFATADGSATAPDDYVAQIGGTVTFPANTTGPQQISIAVNGDTVSEANESFRVQLSAPTNASLARAQGTVTILNDDAAPIITLTPASASVSVGGTTTLTVSVSGAAGASGLIVNLGSNNPNTATVPPTVTVPAGQTSATFQVTGGATTGNATITASSAGFASDTASITTTAGMITITLASPLVGVGRTINGTVRLSQPAPAGGVTVNLASASGAIASVQPAALSIPAGATQGAITVSGIAAGNTQISGSATGYLAGSANVGVTTNLISIDAIPTVGPTQTLQFAVSLANTAADAVTITFTSSDPSIVSVTPSIVIPQGLRIPTQNPSVTGNRIGTAQITATATGFAPDSKPSVVTLTFTFAPAAPIVVEGSTTNVTLGLSRPSPTGGLVVNLSTGNAQRATVPAQITVPAGQLSAVVPLTGVSAGPTTLSAASPGISTLTANVTVNPLPPINIGQITVGGNLQDGIVGSIGTPAPPVVGLAVTITSPDPQRVLLSNSPTTVGTASIVVNVPGNSQSIPQFYVQALANTGTVSLTATAPGYATDTSVVTLVPSGFVITNFGDFATTAFAGNTPLQIRPARLQPGNLAYTGIVQGVRAGLTVPVAVTSGTTQTGVILNSPVSFTADQNIATVQFDPQAIGTTLLTVVPPQSFDTPSTARQITATVNASPVNTTSTVIVGDDLEDNVTFNLRDTPPTPVDVTVTIADQTVARVSDSPTTLGGATVVFPAVADAGSRQYYVQGMQEGTTTITIAAQGFASATQTINIHPSGFVITNVGNFPTSTFSANTALQVRPARLTPTTLTYTGIVQAVRPGLTVPVVLTSDTPQTGVIVGSPLSFTANQTIATAQFDPQAAGTAVLAVEAPQDFDAPSTARQITVTVTAPALSASDTIVGEDLQDPQVVNLGVLPPAPVDLTLSIANGNIARISDNATVQGGTTITFPGVADQSGRTFYVQGLARGATTLTVSAPGFATQTRAITVDPSGFVITNLGNFTTTTFSANTTIQVRPARLTAGLAYTGVVQGIRPGLTVQVVATSSVPQTGVVIDSPLTFDANDTIASFQFDPQSAGTTVLAIDKPQDFDLPTTGQQITATVTASAINVSGAANIGENLQDQQFVNLALAPPSPVDVTLDIASGAIARISTSPTVLGGTSITFPAVANTNSQTYYVHALAQGTTQLTVSAAGYATRVVPVTVDPSGFVIITGNINTTTAAANVTIQVRPARLTPGTFTYTGVVQPLRAELSAAVTLTSSNTQVGVMVGVPLTFNPNVSLLNAQFDPIAAGTSTVTVVTPQGFATPNESRQITATVAQGLIGGDFNGDRVQIHMVRNPPPDVPISPASAPARTDKAIATAGSMTNVGSVGVVPAIAPANDVAQAPRATEARGQAAVVPEAGTRENGVTAEVQAMRAGVSESIVAAPVGVATSIVPLDTSATPTIKPEIASTILADPRVGEGLQDDVGFTLGGIPPTPINVTIGVADPTIARVSDNPRTLGEAVVVFRDIADRSEHTFYLQGLRQGTTQLVISAPGYVTSSRNITVDPAGFVVQSPAEFATSAKGKTATVKVVAARLNARTLVYEETEALRPGVTASLLLDSSDKSAGSVRKALEFGANVGVLEAEFDPRAAGKTSLRLRTPQGFSTASEHQHVTATVTK